MKITAGIDTFFPLEVSSLQHILIISVTWFSYIFLKENQSVQGQFISKLEIVFLTLINEN